MGKSTRKKRQNRLSNSKKGKPQQDVVLAENDELLGQTRCPHEPKAVKPLVLQNKIPHLKLGQCSGCSEGISSDVGVCICLRCGLQGCDRNTENKHSLAHHQSMTSHSVVVHLRTWVVWCYLCDDEVMVSPDSDLHNCITLLLKSMNMHSPHDRQSYKQQKNTASCSLAKEAKPNKLSLNSSKKIKGLTNLGNTCFFNAIMQNLCQTELLHVALSCAMKEDYPYVIKPVGEPQKQIAVSTPAGSLTTALWKVLKEFKGGLSQGVISPKNLFNEVCKKAPRFRGFQQQDSQELLRYLLDSVRMEELRRVKLGLLKSFGLNQASDAKELNDEQRTRVKEYGLLLGAPLVDSVFAGELVSIVICQECSEESRVYEMFLDLSLPLLNVKPSSAGRKSSHDHANAKPGVKAAEDHCKNPTKQTKGRSKHQQKLEKKAQRKKNKRSKQHGAQQRVSRSPQIKNHSDEEELVETDLTQDCEDLVRDYHQEKNKETWKRDATKNNHIVKNANSVDEDVSTKVAKDDDDSGEICIEAKGKDSFEKDVEENEEEISEVNDEEISKLNDEEISRVNDEEIPKLNYEKISKVNDKKISKVDDVKNGNTGEVDVKTECCFTEQYQERADCHRIKEEASKRITESQFETNNKEKENVCGKETQTVHLQQNIDNCEKERGLLDITSEREIIDVQCEGPCKMDCHNCKVHERFTGIIEITAENTVGNNLKFETDESEFETENDKNESEKLDVCFVNCKTGDSEIESWMANEFREEISEGDEELDLEAMDFDIDRDVSDDVGMLVSDIESRDDSDSDELNDVEQKDECDCNFFSGHGNNRHYNRVTSKDLKEIKAISESVSTKNDQQPLPTSSTNKFDVLRNSFSSDNESSGDTSPLKLSDGETSSQNVDCDPSRSTSDSLLPCRNTFVDTITKPSVVDGKLLVVEEKSGRESLLSYTDQSITCNENNIKMSGFDSSSLMKVNDQTHQHEAENPQNHVFMELLEGKQKCENNTEHASLRKKNNSYCKEELFAQVRKPAISDKICYQLGSNCSVCEEQCSIETVKTITAQTVSKNEEFRSVSSKTCYEVKDPGRSTTALEDDEKRIVESNGKETFHETGEDKNIRNTNEDKKTCFDVTEGVHSSFSKKGDSSQCLDVNHTGVDVGISQNSDYQHQIENYFNTSSKVDLPDISESNKNMELRCDRSEEHVEVEQNNVRDEPATQGCLSAGLPESCLEFSEDDKSLLPEMSEDTDEKDLELQCNHSASTSKSPNSVSNCIEKHEDSLQTQALCEVIPDVDESERSLTLKQFYHPSPNECSVLSCLSQFCMPEKLDGRNKFACEACSQRHHGISPKEISDSESCTSEENVEGATAPCGVKNKAESERSRSAVYTVAKKQMLISSAPPVLTLHLKRFQHVGAGLRKISKHVEFPLLLDLSPFCSKNSKTHADSSGRVLYALYGVVEHSGGMHGGHYAAFVKAKTNGFCDYFDKISSLDDLINFVTEMWGSRDQNSKASPVLPGEGQWYYVSDTHVTAVPVTKVLKSQAYMLFYERLMLSL